MDKAKSLGKEIKMSQIDNVNKAINKQIKNGYNKYDVLNDYLNSL